MKTLGKARSRAHRDKDMNILILSETLWPEGSGGELATHLYTRLLVGNKMNVKIAATLSSKSLKDVWSGLSIYKLQAMGCGKYTVIFDFKKLDELIKWSDVIYCTDLFSVVPFVKRRFRKPVIMHVHSYFPACPVGSLYNLKEDSVCESGERDCARCIWYYERAHLRPLAQSLSSAMLNSIFGRFFLDSVRFADAIVFVSEEQRSLFLKHINVYCPSYVVYNPLPKLPYTPIEGDNVGYFGGLSPLKGFHILVKAWSRVNYKHKARLHATKIGKLTNPNPFTRIEIIPYGRLDNNSYANVYRKVKVVGFPSIWQEPLPYVFIEGLLRGRLLISSKVGGIPEMTGGLEGISLVKPNDADALADALDWALSTDRSEAVELGLKNREEILKRFNSYKPAEELIRVFERAIG